MTEMEKLLDSLREMTDEAKKQILNNKETWTKIGQKDLQGAGFESEEELRDFILNNPYSNL